MTPSAVKLTASHPIATSALEKGAEATKNPFTSPADQLNWFLKIAQYEFEAKFGFYGGIPLSLFLSAVDVELEESQSPGEDHLILQGTELFFDILDDLSKHKPKEAAIRCKLLLMEIGTKFDIPSLLILSYLCDESTVEYILSQEIPSIKAKTAEVLDTEYLQAAYSEGCVTAIELSEVLTRTYAPLNLALAKKIQVALHSPVEGAERVSEGKKIVLNIAVPESKIRALGTHLENMGKHRVASIESLLRSAEAFDRNAISTMPELADITFKIMTDEGTVIAEEEKIAAGERIIESNYDFLMAIPQETMSTWLQVLEDAERYLEAKEAENCYMILLLDRTAPAEIFGEFKGKDFEKAIREYRASHTDEELIAIAAKEGKDFATDFAYIRRFSRLLTTLKALYRNCVKMQENFEAQLVTPVATLQVLFKERIIRRPINPLDLTPPVALGKTVFKDNFNHKVTLPRPATTTRLPLTAPPLTAAVSTHSVEEKPAVATIKEEELPAVILEVEVPKLFSSIKNSSLFTSVPAKKAFSNGLQYALVIHNLLVHLNKSASPAEAPQIQKDVAIASYYALEQLTTALLLEKQHITSSEEAMRFYEAAGHNLLTRCAINGLILPKHIKRTLEKLNLKTPSALKPSFLAGLSTTGAKVTIPTLLKGAAGKSIDTLSAKDSALSPSTDHILKTTTHGVEALKAVFWLLHAHCVKPSSKEFSELVHVKEAMESIKPMPTLAADEVTAAPAISTAGGSAIAATLGTAHESLTKLQRTLHFLGDSKIDEKMSRLQYCIQSLNNPEKMSLARFYIHQATYLMLDIMEDSLCRSGNIKGLILNRRSYKHRLDRLAHDIGLTALTGEETDFLQSSYQERNAARYDFDLKASERSLPLSSGDFPLSVMAGAGGATPLSKLASATTNVASKVKESPLSLLTAAAGSRTPSPVGGDDEDIDTASDVESAKIGFATVLSTANSKLKDKMERKMATMLSICEKLAIPLKARAD